MLKTKLSLSVTVTLSLILLSFTLAFARPIMEFKDTSHDFGLIEQGTVNKHIFTFKNTGDENLEIIEVKPSCGCTAALLSSKVIPPGETGEIEVTFNSGKFKDKVKKTVSIHTNEEPRARTEKMPGLGPRLTRAVKEPAVIRKLYITAQVKYDKEEEAKRKKAREAAMKKSKTIPTMEPAPLRTTNLPIKIEHSPKEIALGNIKVNDEHKVDLKLSTSLKGSYLIDRVSVSVPYTSVMITKLDISENNPGEVLVTVNVKSPGEMKNGKVMVYITGNPVPVEVPVTWNAKQQ